MNADEPNDSTNGGSLAQKGLSNSMPRPISEAETKAATSIIRDQVNRIYDTSSIPENSVYNRNHNPEATPDDNQWRKYHSAWQDYYKRYYQSYYHHHYATQKTATTPEAIGGQAQPIDNEEAIFDLRQKLLGKIRQSAEDVRKSRHFLPITSGLLVVFALAFLQYNQLLVANVVAYVAPASTDSQSVYIAQPLTATVGPEPKLIIPKINVDVPVIYNVGSDYASQMNAMTRGVSHFSIPGADSVPGRIGNTALSGHSSNDLFDQGDYKFIFAQLDRLNIGDTIYANYNSVRYTYTVTKKEVVRPNEVNKLTYATEKPVLTLITCTPLGTSTNRLLVTAEQVSPDPSRAVASSNTQASATASIPGNPPTVLERLFGAR
jgi:sortase A